MNHINLGDDYRNLLLEKANWNKIGMSMSDESGATALEEEASAEVAETEEEVVEEENVETAHSCPVCSSEISEGVEPGLFLEHLEKVAELAEAIEYLTENYEASEDEVLLGALSHVFPDEFSGVELEEEEAEEE